MAEYTELLQNPDVPMATYTTPVVMVGGGIVDHNQLATFAQKYPIIAVDSGAMTIADAGFMAELLIGDFDSIKPSARDFIPRQIKIKDQYSTDFQKALMVIDAPVIYGFGFLGRRTDHGLAVLHAMADHADKTIILIDPFDVVMMAQDEFRAFLPQGIRLSVHAMLPLEFQSSKGLVWPLNGLTIGAGATLGTSNQVIIPPGEPEGDVEVIITPKGSTPYVVMVPPEGLSGMMPEQN